MKKLFSVVFVAGLLFAGTASAQMMGGSGLMGNYGTSNGSAVQQASSSNLNAALQAIYQAQNESSQAQISCSKVTDDQFEKLGDAVMGYGITEQQHTAMENMMGGEGSATLRQAHINMGRSYLGCWANYNGAPSYMPMMGYLDSNTSTPQTYGQPGYGMMSGYYGNGMMGHGFGSGWNMMGGYYGGFGWLGAITMILIWALLILGIVALVKWLKRKP